MRFTDLKQNAKTMVSLLLFLSFTLIANAQKLTVTGLVKDAQTGEPIMGANVLEKGTTNGTITSIDGDFSLPVDANAVLVIKYVGYEPAEIAVKGQKKLLVQLKENSVELGEVVAIGYATVKKNDATGSVVAIKPDQMNKGLTTNAQDMMVGKIAGVTVTSDGGTPGGGSTIRIRGGSSINASNDPLYVIDGLPMDNEGIKGVANLLSTINPNDIESFTVLKDASATAIYGSRASNGVIIITTKKGEKGSKPRVSYNGSLSVGSVAKTLDVMTGDELRDYVTALYGAGSTAASLLGTENTNWQKQIYQTAIGHDHSVSVAGGLKNMPYRANFGYTNQDGILKTSNFERYTASISLSPSFFDNHLTTSFNFKGMFAHTRYAETGVVNAAAVMDPTQPVKTNDPLYSTFGGYWQWYTNSAELGITTNTLATKNPLATLQLKTDQANSNDIIMNADFDYKFHFLPELRAHLMLGMNAANGKQTTFIPVNSGSNHLWGNEGYEKKYKTNKQLTYYMQYGKELGIHKFDVMGGYEWQHFYNDGNNSYAGIISSIVGPDNKTHTNVQDNSNEWASESYLVSFFGRANYSLANQLLLTATVRYDGTSRFSSANRWGLFPSVALAWKMNETFLKDSETISDMKLRLGYGITGQQNVSSNNYSYMPSYYASQDGAYYPFGSVYYPSWRPSAYNEKLKWEETTTYNAGLDLGFLNNRITSSVDVYYRPTKDLIFTDAPIAQGSNFSNVVIQNVGSLFNKGVEFTISAKPVVTKDFNWDITYNVTYNYNEVTKITSNATVIETGESISSGTGNKVQAIAEGFPAWSYYVYEQVYDQNNKPIEGLYVDRNGDGKINDDDRYMYHHASPDVTMGLSSKFVYKAFDLGFAMHANIGNYVFNDVASSKANIGISGVYSTSGFVSNVAKSALETNFTGKTNWYFSDYYVQNASFLRLDNITLGYSFKHIAALKVNGRISATAQNVATFTKYKGLDPELPGGVDKSIYPRPFQTVFGLTLNF